MSLRREVRFWTREARGKVKEGLRTKTSSSSEGGRGGRGRGRERGRGGVRGTRWVGGFVGDVAEAEFDDVWGLVWLSGEVANDAVWGGEAEVVGEECAPGNGGVEGMENLVELLLGEREKRGCHENTKHPPPHFERKRTRDNYNDGGCGCDIWDTNLPRKDATVVRRTRRLALSPSRKRRLTPST
ncbi:hypothetical protein CR513_52330, partial [Mucuna pruriens]